MRRALLTATIGLLLTPAIANAGWKTTRATAIATHVWGVCQNTLRIHFTPADPAWADSYGWAWTGNCNVYIDTTIGARYWEPFCTTVIHETGHVAGLGHSDNPRSVMRANSTFVEIAGTAKGKFTSRWYGVDPRCRDRGRPYMEANELL